MKFNKFLPAVAMFACAAAFAQQPTVGSLERLFEAQQFDKALDKMFQESEKAVLVTPAALNLLAAVPVEKRPQAEAVLRRYARQSVQVLNTAKNRAEFRKIAIDGARKVYTQEEVDALIGFYGTPVGQSVMDKMPQYFAATMEPLVKAVAQEQLKSGQKYAPQFDREMNRVLCGKDKCQKDKR